MASDYQPIKDQENNDDNQGQRRTRIIVIVLAAAVLLMGGGLITSLVFNQQKAEKIKKVEKTNEDLNEEMKQLNKDMSNLKQELANANTTIEEKESRIDSLKKRIASLQAALNRRIQQAKQRNEKISEYESMLEELEFREKKLEKQLADLKKENKRLKGENKQLTEKKKELEETTEKQEKTITEQQDTIEKARVLSAESFSYIGINGRGKVKEKNEYKIERTVLNNGGSIKICSHVLKNPTVPKKQYDLYYVITGPDGKQIYSEQRGSGTFKFNGQNKQYTAKKNINYNQDRMKVCMQYTTPEDFKYTKGTHKVEIYWQDHLIGENEFFVSGWQPFN